MRRSFLPVASDFISEKEIHEIIDLNAHFLNILQCTQIFPLMLEDFKQLCYFIITGGTEQQILDLYSKRSRKHKDEEVILLAHDGNNSLPAALEVLARFQQNGRQGKVIYLPDAGENLPHHPKPAIREFEDSQSLAGKRIGLIGQPSDWLVASSPSIETVKTSFGIEIVPH